MNSIRMILCTTLLAILFGATHAAPGMAAEPGKTVDALTASNQKKSAVPWISLQPGQKNPSGFGLAPDGTLSYAGHPLQPTIKVADENGQASNHPSEVRISPVSPSGHFALMTACEPVASANNLCWFQYLLDLKNGRLYEVAWAKYPTPVHVWWGKEDGFAVLPIDEEGELWLAVVDLQKRTSRDIHFGAAVAQAGGALPCKPDEGNIVPDLETLAWLSNNTTSLSVAILCGQPARAYPVKSVLDLETGHIQMGAQTTPTAPAKATASFDCHKAASAVEKILPIRLLANLVS
ncbi:MAG: hypothetical protein HQL87_17220 [Magnetococcales bacterium]|nr:hypothetical protein [Magnetococcales bacterium]